MAEKRVVGRSKIDRCAGYLYELEEPDSLELRSHVTDINRTGAHRAPPGHEVGLASGTVIVIRFRRHVGHAGRFALLLERRFESV